MRWTSLGVAARTRIRRLAGVLALAVLAGGIWLLGPHLLPREATTVGSGGVEVPAVLRYEEPGFLYTYHIITDTESLFDVRSDPRCLRNLAGSQPDRMKRLRDLLTEKMGVADLRDLTAWYEHTIERLRGLGYL